MWSSTFLHEGREPGTSVPHYLPDKNPFVDELVKLYHLPPEAVLGYRETLYPEYRKNIKDTYVPPPPCTQSCGQAGNFVLRPQVLSHHLARCLGGGIHDQE